MANVCNKCKQLGEDREGVHTFQFRDGDPAKDRDGVFYHSRVVIVSLCEEHWEQVRQLAGVV